MSNLADYLTLSLDELSSHAGGPLDLARPTGLDDGPGRALELELRLAPRECFRRRDTRGWELDIALQPTAETVRFASLDLAAELVLGPAPRVRAFVPSGEPTGLDGALENILRVSLAYLALARGGLVVHSASVVRAGQAALFVGHSGAGKSTLARRARAHGLCVPSDDLNIVLPEARGFAITRSIFGGDAGPDLAAPIATPLGLVGFLAKGGRDEQRPLSAGSAVARLLACCPFVATDPYRADQVLHRCGELVQRVPAVEQWFTKEGPLDVLTTTRAAEAER